ncbi:hypothetical protein K461DRAFT_37547 [Myriangium duriaei CBS 260.36]|uniref:Uncharacterized protein n=1 Tax=Myriangium duriaei CBS 260.36 TaxID=1168546 RepID=A0A9P4IU13_9PEZI|nr:hypothetical protein K461DRAFT_37547 [Myriangium duriaei CBS 260.36]
MTAAAARLVPAVSKVFAAIIPAVGTHLTDHSPPRDNARGGLIAGMVGIDIPDLVYLTWIRDCFRLSDVRPRSKELRCMPGMSSAKTSDSFITRDIVPRYCPPYSCYSPSFCSIAFPAVRDVCC